MLIHVLNGLVYGGLLYLVAVGLVLIFGLRQVVNFAHGGLFMLGAYVAYAAIAIAGFWGGLVVATLTLAVVGLVLDRTVFRQLQDQDPIVTVLVTFGLLLNLVGVMGEATKDQVWGYLANYVPEASAEKYPELDRLIDHALAYARDFVAPTLQRRAPEPQEAEALRQLDTQLAALPVGATAEDIQNIVYEIGKTDAFPSLRDWFKALYETLLGSAQGPRMGSFIALYGVDNSRKLIAEALAKA